MASSDFDDIFGDLKEDEQFSPSITGGADLDDASIFGDAPSAVMNMKPSVSKPTSLATGSAATPAADQDEFLSWLDDGPTSNSAAPAAESSAPAPLAPPPPASVQRPPAMDTIDLGDEDDDFLTATPAPRSNSYDDEPLDSPPSADLAPVNPMPPSITVHVNAPAHSTISLDDDDDDLEKIIEDAKAKARKSGSRESSTTSLQIKSQRNSSGQVSQFDADALIKAFNSTGVISTPAARVAMWHHALCSNSTKESISMYAVQTTSLDLANQPVLRKDVEDMCTTIFSSAIHSESLRHSSSSSGFDSAEGARLLFIDNAEILVTYLCKKLHLAEYPPGFAFTFGPAIAISGNDPLRMDLIATLQAACHQVMPHLAKQIAPQQIAEARRVLLKWLLLYHAPSVAFHLDQHFHQWNTDARTIPDSWLASMFESESSQSTSFDALAQVWDCCTLLDVSGSKLAATKAFPSTTSCFIVIHLIVKAGRKLLRMEGDRLQHCMAETLVETLKDTSDEPLIISVRRLIDATPPSVCIKLRDAGLQMAEPSSSSVPKEAPDAKTASKPFSIISASTNGVMQMGSMVIDMPTRLLTTMVPIKFTLGSSPAGAGAKDHSANEEFFTQLMTEATPSSSVCVTLSASEVIPQVFRSFQAPQTDETIRYFMIDCRASEETRQGQIPTAFHFDPDAVTDPAVLDTVLATLEPLKTTVHMCVMGHGYGYIADELRQFLASQQSGVLSSSSELPFFLKDEFLENFARDISRVNAAVLFLAKRGFPHVSVLEGGYAAAHSTLLYSGHEGYSVADLIDHDAPQCMLCQHRRPSTASSGSFTNRTESRSSRASVTGDGPGEDAGRTSNPPSRGSSAAMLPQMPPKLSNSGSGELDARSLFDAHASPVGSGSSYFSSFAGALKTGGKAMGMGMIPTASLKDSSKWLMGKKPATSNPGSPAPGDPPSPVAAKSPLGSAGLPNLSKLKNSLSQLGSEGLKKAEQAATKTSQLKGMFGSVSSPNVKASTAAGFTSSSSSASTPTGGGGDSRNGSFQRAEEEVFTIDDDDEEEQDDFVGSGRTGGGSSRTSSSSSMSGHRSDSFTTGSSTDAGGVPSTVVLHTVEKDRVKELTKGMRVSRTQMLPFVESPFFSAYKKKKPAASPTNAAAAASGRGSMLPRRLVVAENHIVVLKAERNMDDVYSIKSCHHLAHLGRMTCLKKNALMVTMYYKWKAPHTGEVVEKKNAYEVQQRDEFIKVIKNAMEKM